MSSTILVVRLLLCKSVQIQQLRLRGDARAVVPPHTRVRIMPSRASIVSRRVCSDFVRSFRRFRRRILCVCFARGVYMGMYVD